MLKINPTELSSNIYTRTVGDLRQRYEVSNLIQFAKEQKYKVFNLPVEGIDLSCMFWTIEDMRDIAKHYLRVKNADLSKPVFLDDYGIIMDGWHRIIKAIIDGKDSVKAIRFLKMPDPSSSETVKTN